MQKRSVFIATPAYGGQVAIQYAASLLGTCADLNANGVACVSSLVFGGPYIASERNHAVRRFLASGCTHLLFVDGDLEFPHDGAMRLLNADKPVIGGLYPFKSDIVGFPVSLGTGPEVDGLIPCDGLPTGFMLIKREVIEAMIDAYPHLAYTENEHRLYALFDCELKDGRWWGEDYVFCRRWKDMGGEIWAYPDLTFSHCGSKAWKGNYSEHIRG